MRFFRLIDAVESVHGHIVPLHHHPGGSCLIALFHHHPHKIRLIQIGDHQQFLSFIQIQTVFNDQIGIRFQTFTLHKKLLSS
jgi:hypothetical protein